MRVDGDFGVTLRRTLNTSFFFLQAEDGIRDWSVTGVQTCALPISTRTLQPAEWRLLKQRAERLGPRAAKFELPHRTSRQPSPIRRCASERARRRVACSNP